MVESELPSPLFKRILVRECKICNFAQIFVHPCHRDFSRESLCENAQKVSEQWSPRTPAIATFQENPCAKIKTAKLKKLTCQLLVKILARKPRQQRAQFGGWVFSLHLKETFLEMYENP